MSIERSKREKRGPGPVVDVSSPCPISPFVDVFVSTVFETPEGALGPSSVLSLNPVFNNPITAGMNPTAVKRVESFSKVPGLARLRHLSATFEKHQKFATLSSNSPREKGNILVIRSRIALGEANGGRNGKKIKMNDTTVTAPSCRKSLPLHGVV